MERDARGGIVGERLCLFRGVHGKVILDILGIQRGEVELLHETDQLGAGEVTEGVTGQAQMNGRWLSGGLRRLSERGNCAGRGTCRGKERAGLNEAAT